MDLVRVSTAACCRSSL
ncbi:MULTISPECIES: hypothetical protein [Rhodococcus]